jgi:hypothetical protein
MTSLLLLRCYAPAYTVFFHTSKASLVYIYMPSLETPISSTRQLARSPSYFLPPKPIIEIYVPQSLNTRYQHAADIVKTLTRAHLAPSSSNSAPVSSLEPDFTLPATRRNQPNLLHIDTARYKCIPQPYQTRNDTLLRLHNRARPPQRQRTRTRISI